MKIASVDTTLSRLAELISQGRFEELETDTLEIKPVPADGHNHYSKKRLVSAKIASFDLWHERVGESAAGDIEQFDVFYRKIRYVFNQLQKDGFIEKPDGGRGYALKGDADPFVLRPVGFSVKDP